MSTSFPGVSVTINNKCEIELSIKLKEDQSETSLAQFLQTDQS